MQHVNGLAVLEQGHGWRGWWKFGQNAAQVRDRSFIGAGKNSGDLRGSCRMLQCHANGRARTPSSTAAHGIDDHQDGTTAGLEQPVHVGGSASFLDTVSGEVGTHGSDENFGIGHDSILAGASSAGLPRVDWRYNSSYEANAIHPRLSGAFRAPAVPAAARNAPESGGEADRRRHLGGAHPSDPQEAGRLW